VLDMLQEEERCGVSRVGAYADRYETCVHKVGPEGTLNDLPPVAYFTPAWTQTHDSYENVVNAHDMVVNGIEGQLISL